jgi:hypothetical protein
MEPKINKLISKQPLLTVLFYVFIGILLVQRILLFFTVNTDCIDSDQPFMWAGAMDYAQGKFYEPRFYGQNYNTFMEAFFSVPFIWMGFPVYYALPIATHIIFLFPFLFTAFYLFAKSKRINAVLVLAVILCLTPAYDIITSLPRGFVTGAFFSSFFIINLLNPTNQKALVVNLFMILLGYFISANSLLVSLPFLLFIFLYQYKNKMFYILGLIMMFCALPLYFIFDYFYVVHPSYIIYGFSHEFSWQYLWANICSLNQPFGHIGFFMEKISAIVLITFALLAYFLFKKTRIGFYSFLTFILFLLLTLASAKSRDGTFWPWYSFSRMLLGVPVVIYLMLSLIEFKSGKLLAIALSITLFFSVWKLVDFNSNLIKQTDKSNWLGVHLVSLKSVTEAAKFYHETCQKKQVNYFLISNGFWLNTYLDYGGPAITKDFPETQETNSERRYWVRERDRNRVIPRFVFISETPNFDKLVPKTTKFKLQRIDDYGLFLVEENKLKMQEFINISRYYELRQ